jgi:hypothetical protein
VVSLGRAEQLAASVMERFRGEGAKFFTNGEFKNEVGAGLVLTGWDPATDATFDTGVIILGATESGCVWVADED